MRFAVLARRQSDDQGTPGILVAPRFSCYALELPDRGNHPKLSRIPAGAYDVEWSLSPRLRIFTYEILNVPDRGGIRLHSGNLAGDTTKGFLSDSLGCPLLGNVFGAMNGQRAVLVSRSAVTAFESAMQREPFRLIIKDANG